MTGSSQHLTVAVVEDDPRIRQLIEDEVVDEGHQVESFVSAESFLEGEQNPIQLGSSGSDAAWDERSGVSAHSAKHALGRPGQADRHRGKSTQRRRNAAAGF